MEKNKKELIKEANELSEKYNFKKEVIEKILDDLDKEKKLTNSHIEGMSTIQSLLEEMDVIEKEHQELEKKIRD